jgi:hypothetical protein
MATQVYSDRVFIETMYDPRRRQMLLQATTGFGTQPYRVTVKDVSHDEGVEAALQFAQMYRDNGSEVVTR